MTSIGPAMVVSMGTDTVVHLRLSPTQNPVQKRGNSTDTLPLSLTKQVQLYDRPSSRKTALEPRFPGTFVAIYSRPPILVAWNFPLTSMKLYECCPLTSMHPRRLRTEQQQQNLGLPRRLFHHYCAQSSPQKCQLPPCASLKLRVFVSHP